MPRKEKTRNRCQIGSAAIFSVGFAGVVAMTPQSRATTMRTALGRISLGIEIDLQKNILFRFGFQDQSEQIAGGLGLIVKGHSIDYGLTYNSILGYTHSFSLSFILFR